jgi:hypothetical protein
MSSGALKVKSTTKKKALKYSLDINMTADVIDVILHIAVIHFLKLQLSKLRKNVFQYHYSLGKYSLISKWKEGKERNYLIWAREFMQIEYCFIGLT